MHDNIDRSFYLLLRPLFKDLNVYSVQTEEAPYIDVLQLAIPPQTSDRLRLAGLIDLLRWREEGREEDSVIGGREVRAARALIHDVQEEHTLLAVVLELLQVLALHRRGTLDLEEGDLVRGEGLGDFGGEVGELNEDENALIFGDGLPTQEWVSSAVCMRERSQRT